MHLSCELDTFMFAILTAGSLEVCYDHVQLRVLSGHSGRSSLTPVTVTQLYFH